MGQPLPKTMSLGHLTNGLTWAQIRAANPQTVYSGDVLCAIHHTDS